MVAADRSTNRSVSRAATCVCFHKRHCVRGRACVDDITVVGMPLTAICNATYTDPRQRQLFKNIIYLGALSILLDIDPDAIIGTLSTGR